MEDSVQELIFLLCTVHAVNQDRSGMFLFSVQATEPQHCDAFGETQH